LLVPCRDRIALLRFAFSPSTVAPYAILFFTGGQNDLGQIAFAATIGTATPQSGGSMHVIVLATPVPEPASIGLAAAPFLCGLLRRRNKATACD